MRHISLSRCTRLCCGALALIWTFTLPAFSGTIREIQNTKSPKGTAKTLKLEETLRLGPEQDEEHFVWPSIQATVAVNDAGHMFVVDNQGNQIVEIDPEGQFVRNIGGQGQGPGEFQALAGFQFLADGSGIAFEFLGPATRFSIFDADGNFKETKNHSSFESILRGLQYSPNGKLMGAVYVSIDQVNSTTHVHTGILNADMEVLKELTQFESPLPDPSRLTDPEYWADMLAQQIARTSTGNLGFSAFDAQNRVYTAVANTYEITQWDPEMNALMRFGRKYEPVPLTQAEITELVEPITEAVKSQLPPQFQAIITDNVIKSAVEKAELPPFKNPVNGLIVMDNGMILVVFDANVATGQAHVDMFDPEGAFVGWCQVPAFSASRLTFHDGQLYTIERDDDGENELVRYSYEIVAQ